MRSKLKRKNNLKSTSKKVKVQDVHIFLSIRIIFCKYNLWITVDAICAKQESRVCKNAMFYPLWNVFPIVEILLLFSGVNVKNNKTHYSQLRRDLKVIRQKKMNNLCMIRNFLCASQCKVKSLLPFRVRADSLNMKLSCSVFYH